MKKQAIKKSVAKKTTQKIAAKKTVQKKSTPVVTKKAATKPVVEKQSKGDRKLMHQIDWLTKDVVNGYFVGVDSDILSKSDIKDLQESTNNHQEIFDYLSAEKQVSADFSEFILFYMHTLVFTGAGKAVYKEWKDEYAKFKAKKKK